MRIAIVGAGASGLSALWILKQHSNHEVNIYEKNDYVGGHAHTVEFKSDGKESVLVDTGVVAFHSAGSPNLLRFLRYLGVPVVPFKHNLSVLRDSNAFTWSSNGLRALLAQPLNLFNPRIYRTIFDTFRFKLFATDLLGTDDDYARHLTLAQYLELESYSSGFVKDYLLVNAITTMPFDYILLDLPAYAVIRLLQDHGLLHISAKSRWVTVEGGTQTYVNKIVNIVPQENLHLRTEIVAITSHDHGVTLEEPSGVRHVYDHVIVATPAYNTLSMLRRGGGATIAEEKVLGSVRSTTFDVVLHRENKVLPECRGISSACNYTTMRVPPDYDDATMHSKLHTSMTYDMNKIQHLDQTKYGPVLLTINPSSPIDDSKTSGRWQYELPTMSGLAISAQRLLPAIQNQRGVSFIGAWAHNGLHEDAITSALQLVVESPFHATPPFLPCVLATSKTDSLGTSVGVSVARHAINRLENGRRALEPHWTRVTWVIVLVLAWVERLTSHLGLIRISCAVAQFCASWEEPKVKGE